MLEAGTQCLKSFVRTSKVDEWPLLRKARFGWSALRWWLLGSLKNQMQHLQIACRLVCHQGDVACAGILYPFFYVFWHLQWGIPKIRVPPAHSAILRILSSESASMATLQWKCARPRVYRCIATVH